MQKLGKFLLWTALILGVLIGILRATAIRWWRVPEGDPYLEASIAPTLRGGDFVILWRGTKPKFGDLVTCPEPKAPERMVIGRIIGDPGDKVHVEGAKVSVNGRGAETEHACKPHKFKVNHPSTGAEIEQNCDVEAVAGVSHMRGSTAGHGVQPTPVDQTVEAGKYFLVSDNRLLPYDSRDFGLVDVETCKETVFFRVVSRGGYFDSDARFTVIY
ncbi:MAG: signal peptidase I [Polyangiaceae bacterium]|nr:signal peptidase I [Myxococcales bacterium]MCC6902654.1 signal peptidase I [Polyangiaceae bacterium]